jgi:adenylyl-sulfate kinase
MMSKDVAVHEADVKCGRAFKGRNIYWHDGKVTAAHRQRYFGHVPATIWLTGLSGAGKSTLAYELEKLLLDRGHPSFVLDGDNVRHHLNRDLGFSVDDRRENIRRTAEVARLMNQAGLFVVTAFISPLRGDRQAAREIIGAEHFVEAHVCTPMAVCESRDPKGLYALARMGKIENFTGVSAPYEPPEHPDIAVDTEAMSLEQATRALYDHLARRFD